MHRGAWWAAVHGVAKSRTQLSWLSTQACILWAVGTHCKFLILEWDCRGRFNVMRFSPLDSHSGEVDWMASLERGWIREK